MCFPVAFSLVKNCYHDFYTNLWAAGLEFAVLYKLVHGFSRLHGDVTQISAEELDALNMLESQEYGSDCMRTIENRIAW
jgi:gamma-glutamylcyclotransferase (GGCT)/AIG2-like uncharacterized protein YtfP